MAQRATYCNPHTGYRQTKPHIGWMLFENDVSNYLGARSFIWRERPAWKDGHWEHLDVTHETVDCARGSAHSFPHLGITKVGYEPSLTVRRCCIPATQLTSALAPMILWSPHSHL